MDRNSELMPQAPPARTVGARLREARERRGVSLRQIANSTRISVMSLEALERSDLSRLPGGIFTRAFIRAYAEEVGLDPDRTMQDFIAELPPEAANATARSVMTEDGEQLESDRRAVATAMRLAAVSLPIIGLVVYFGLRGPAADTSAPLPVEPAAAAPETAGGTGAEPQSAEAPATPAASAPAGSVPAAGLTMEISPRGACWVSVTADGEPAFSGVMRPGDKQVVHAKEQITFNVGDAGAFAFTLNGRAGRPLGAPGDVVSGRITPSNLNDFITP